MTSAECLVKVKALSKTYGIETQKIYALQNISLEILRRDFVALCGPSGSGKTTLLNIMGALDKQDEGEIEIVGRSLSSLNTDQMTELRLHTLGFIFQSYNLIPVMTVLENASFILNLRRLPKEEVESRAHDALKILGLDGYEKRFPHQLSGGQQQRVAVARALAARPEILFADEPTANLDSKSAGELLDAMEMLNDQHHVTFVFATHDPRIMERAKRTVMMRDGHLIEDLRRDT